MTKWIDVYNNKDGSYMHSIAKTDENVANYVASLTPSQQVKLVDPWTDLLLLTTIGNFIDFIPDQLWYIEKLAHIVLPKQLGYSPIEPVATFDKDTMEDINL